MTVVAYHCGSSLSIVCPSINRNCRTRVETTSFVSSPIPFHHSFPSRFHSIISPHSDTNHVRSSLLTRYASVDRQSCKQSFQFRSLTAAIYRTRRSRGSITWLDPVVHREPQNNKLLPSNAACYSIPVVIFVR